MGGQFSANKLVDNFTGYVTGRKRKHEESEEEYMDKIIDIALHTPKKKKLLSTARYIYQALFEEGKNSDVTVCALDKEFHLHKIYLCQSPYFGSMFGGSWIETTKNYVTIDIVDPLINIESLRMVFGSLYDSEVILEPLRIISILATATMFQLDGLIEKCSEVMLETINPKTSLDYYKAACQYGDRKLRDACFNWFLANLMTYYFSNPLSDLKIIPVELMKALVVHPDLYVMQTEYSIYVMLKYWIYMKLHNQEVELSSKAVNNYFFSRKHEVAFLLSSEGKQFIPVFSGLRFHHLISQKLDIDLIQRDNIIPSKWINPVVVQQWKHVLRVDQNECKGPSEVCDDYFLNTSLRCGRILQVKERHVWRWTGFHFGMDLIMITDGFNLSIKRNNRSEYGQLVSLQTTRHITIRVMVVKLNEQRQIIYSKQTDILRLSLSKGEEIQLLTLDGSLEYPIIIAANILYTSPDAEESTQDQAIQTVS